MLNCSQSCYYKTIFSVRFNQENFISLLKSNKYMMLSSIKHFSSQWCGNVVDDNTIFILNKTTLDSFPTSVSLIFYGLLKLSHLHLNCIEFFLPALILKMRKYKKELEIIGLDGNFPYKNLLCKKIFQHKNMR